MGYRGDDASHWGDPRREEPWQGPGRDEYGDYDGYGSQGGYGAQGGYDPQGGQQQYQGGHAAPGDYGQPGGYGGQPAGGFPDNDWYGDSRSGGFADTSMHNRPAIPEGYRPGDYDAPSSQVSQTRHQPVLNDGPDEVSYPGYENVEDHGGFGTGGYPAQPGYDDYANYQPPPTTAQPIYHEPAPTSAEFAVGGPAPTTANPVYDDQSGGFDGQTAVFTPGSGGPGGYSDSSYGDDFDDGREAQDPFPIPGGSDDALETGPAAVGKRRPAGKKGKKGARGSSGRMSAARSAAASRTATIARPGTGRKRGNRKLLIGGSGVVLLGALAAVYFLVIAPSGNPNEQALPATGSNSTPVCSASLGQFCHITNASGDPSPLSVNELYPQAVLNEKDKTNFTRLVTENDKDCTKGLLGSALQKAAKTGKCTQVVRASYSSGSGSKTIVGTIGVVNLTSTGASESAGKTVSTSDFVWPLASNSGDGANIGKSTGVEQAQVKGHYLILTWAEWGNEATPSSSDQQTLEQWENDLISSSANIALSQRMVSGKSGGGA